jgi:hypothetical protein
MIVGKTLTVDSIKSRCDGRHLNVPFRTSKYSATEDLKIALAISETSFAHEIFIHSRTKLLKKMPLKMGLCEGSDCGIGGILLSDAQANKLSKWLDDYLGS